MRKSATLLTLAVMLLAAGAWLLLPAQVLCEELEPTDSGAPSAIVIFPVGTKPNPNASAMPPVAFNHLVHERWAEKKKVDCIACHHTGDPVACTTCHTVEGTPDSKGVSLQKAMHTPYITSKAADKPSSCVSCHESRLKNKKCAGCHTRLVGASRFDNQWCTVCHTITPGMNKQQLEAGINNKLSASKNEQIAEATALARKPVQYWSPLLAPYKVKIDAAEGQYEPVTFNHRHHVASLQERIDKNRLAGAFHSNPATLCMTCHHHSPASETPPKCGSCHSNQIDLDQPARPKLTAAYHLQCMNCHTDMKVGRPRNSDCETCHKLKPGQTANLGLGGL